MRARGGRGRHGARHRVVPHRGRRDGAVAGVSARRVTLRMAKGASPVFAISILRSSPSARTSCGRVARGRAPVRVRGVRRAAARAARALHEEERRRDRRPALQLHRQGRSRGRAASGDDADVRAHGGGARERAAQAGALVLDAAALPVRAPAEGAVARALPAQRRHRRRAEDVTADAELLAVAIDIMRAFGLSSSDVRARVSDRRLLRALLAELGVTDDAIPACTA